MIIFKDGVIAGVEIKKIKKYSDERGWLMEVFRKDEIMDEFLPVMTYVSMTKPGVVRGPHEHVHQADYFCFAGPSDFRVYLWDNRPASFTKGNKMAFIAGESASSTVIVPKGIVHAYKNIGACDGLVINCPNRLFMGPGRKDPVDEVRYEGDPNSPYRLEI
ncbi:MAG: dTDP-4-dehydrorhamnose 3,5-epimerase family protein [Deltaproteobacteria bacterium]|nr:dTDP-4-dehydrorhamnose 3,5-epimerase family protein [Deltaproteobacteria bacterium]